MIERDNTMENNNDNNLFTNMFGVESEETKVEPAQVAAEQSRDVATVQEPTPVVASSPVVKEQPQSPIPSPIPPQAVTPVNQTANEELITLDSNNVQIQSAPANPVPEVPPVVEQPVEQPVIQPQFSPQPQNTYNELDFSQQPKEVNYKLICIILAVTLVIIGALFLAYTGIDNYLKNNPPAQEPPVVEEQQKEEEKPTPQAPVEPAEPIKFDLTLSFDKGDTTDVNEYHVKQGFKPAKSEGVVLCQNISPVIYGGVGVENVMVYIYYKDYQTKKILTINDWQLIDQKNYNEILTMYQTTTAIVSGNEHMDTQIRIDQKEYIVQYFMLADLAYNQAVRIPESKYYFDIKISYNTPIQKAMNKFLTQERYTNNMYCTTIVTSEASI